MLARTDARSPVELDESEAALVSGLCDMTPATIGEADEQVALFEVQVTCEGEVTARKSGDTRKNAKVRWFSCERSDISVKLVGRAVTSLRSHPSLFLLQD
jgi:hypothetical protein